MREQAKKMSAVATETSKRMRVVIRGAVQGVGFRPFIFRLANDLRLAGWVKNSSGGVIVEIEGGCEKLEKFLLRIEPEKPPRSSIQGLEYSYFDAAGYTAFEILESDQSGAKVALILPDIAICSDCLTEIFDSNNRRHQYPFTNCTNCGPRYTIITTLPYDRPNGFVEKPGYIVKVHSRCPHLPMCGNNLGADVDICRPH